MFEKEYVLRAQRRKRFYKLLKEVRADFPEIRRPILLLPVAKKDFYMATVWCFIFYDTNLNKASDGVIKGLLAHELGHMLSMNYSERDCDRIAVQRGYLKSLIAFNKWHNIEHKKYKKSEGLTLNELIKLSKQILH